jgi:hypothetical protein
MLEEYKVFSVVILMGVVEMIFNRNQRTTNDADIIQRSPRQRGSVYVHVALSAWSLLAVNDMTIYLKIQTTPLEFR